jgi:hypothetical protein
MIILNQTIKMSQTTYVLRDWINQLYMECLSLNPNDGAIELLLQNQDKID